LHTVVIDPFVPGKLGFRLWWRNPHTLGGNQMLNRDIVQGNWKQVRGRIREKWAALTDDDLEKVRGQWDRLEGVLQEKYGKSRENFKDSVRSFESELEKDFSDDGI
jgi:uncharacterized protein YjbJ (UPF0337 family)